MPTLIIIVCFIFVSVLKYFIALKSGIVYLVNILVPGYHLMCYCQNTKFLFSTAALWNFDDFHSF